MKKPIISTIASVARDRAIGNKNQLLWDIPEDLQHFKRITTGHPVIMGDKTYESIGRPLPNRTNIIITLNKNYEAEGCFVVYSIDEAIEKAKEIDQEEIFVIGGGSIYKQMLPMTDKLYITLVEGEYEADTYFPDYSEFKNVVSEEKQDNGKYKYTFLELTR